MTIIFKKYPSAKYVVCLLAISLIACFGTLIYAPIFDFADEFFPVRWFMMDSLENGIWPFWCPYRSMGTPAHADPQSFIFYIPFWLLSLVGHYSPFFWGAEFIFHVFMAGCGFYLLAHIFSKRDHTCFVIACCYMLCGVFTGNTQHYSWIIAMTWLPFAFYFLLSIFDNPTTTKSIGLAFSLSLLFTGGYSGFAFILFYFFLFYAAFQAWNLTKTKNFKKLKSISCFLCVSGILLLLMALPSFISFGEATDYVTRGDGLSYENATKMAFIPKAMLTAFFPWMSGYDRGWMPLDISMRSIFVGVLTIYFFITGLFQKNNANSSIMLVFGIVCLILSFGSQLPTYRIAYMLPFINMLRFQTIFRCFVVVTILIFAIKGIDAFVSNTEKYKKSFLLFLSVLGIMYVIVFVCNILHVDKSSLINCDNHFHWALQSFIYIVILSVTALLVLNKKGMTFNKISFLIITDVIISAWLCLASTGYQKNFTNKQFQSLLNEEPKDFPIQKEVTSNKRIQREKNYYTLWKNLGCISKKIEWSSRDPFKLKNHKDMIQKYLDENIELYLPAAIFSPQNILYSNDPTILSIDTAYTTDIDKIRQYKEQAIINQEKFEPGNIVFSSQSNESQPIVIAQMFYPGWKAILDDSIPMEINIMNKAMMTLYVPQGKHTVKLYYDRFDCKIAFFVQCLTILFSLLFIAYSKYFKNKRMKLATTD